MNYYDSLTLGEDLLLMWGLDSGTLKIEGQADIALSGCILDEPTDTREMDASGGQVVQQDAIKIWPTSKSPKPPLGSVIVDDKGVYWTILTVRYKNQVNTWECNCRNLSINQGLVDGVAINRATILKANVFRKGMANETIPVWRGYVSGQRPPTVADQVACRFQPSSSDAIIRFSGEFEKETYRCFFEQPLPVDLAGSEYRLVDMNGERYRIVSYFDADRIDRLPCCIAIKIIEGSEYFRPYGTPLPLPSPIQSQG